MKLQLQTDEYQNQWYIYKNYKITIDNHYQQGEYRYLEIEKDNNTIGTTSDLKKAKAIINEDIKNTTFKCRRYNSSDEVLHEYRGFLIELRTETPHGYWGRYEVSGFEHGRDYGSSLNGTKTKIDNYKTKQNETKKMITKTIVIDLENSSICTMDKEHKDHNYKLIASGIINHDLDLNNLRLVGLNSFDELIAKMNVEQDLDEWNDVISNELYYNDEYIGDYSTDEDYFGENAPDNFNRDTDTVYVLDIFDIWKLP